MSTESKTSRKVIEKQLIINAWKDPNFLVQLQENPKNILEVAIGNEMPEVVRVHVHIEDEHNIHIVIPARPNDRIEGDEVEPLLNSTTPAPSTPNSGLTNCTIC